MLFSSKTTNNYVLIAILIFFLLIFFYKWTKMLLCYRVTQQQRLHNVEEFVPEAVTTKGETIIEVVINISEEAITTPAIKGKNSDCSICIEEIKHGEMVLILPVCCHRFHYVCIRPWLKENNTCPMCRSSVRESPLPYARIDDIMETLNNHQDLQSSSEIV
ncbi:hypothetical protein R3W88_012485 [Solanum pinnatisectum]|uniref:RING-type domain-containing protein n=1 Tax=Solanum pinnatisectum TaxID=50273 RepID=A0AAV9LAD9_9SOLN|nr:hypothetical protein R3W88_012485 [Solanum pinnatisectum]